MSESKKNTMLISVFIPTYNRAHCIEKVLDAVLAMEVPTGVDVEYIWSDDCSSDGTFEILQRRAAEYKGPWKIILNRNEKNLKQALHFLQIGKIGHGEWFVECDSDDFSQKNRLLIFLDYIKKFPQMRGFCTGLNIIQKDESLIYSGIFRQRLFPCGATCCWHKECFTKFNTNLESTCSQDVYIPFRALLLGGEWVFADIPTVQYTIGNDNDSTPSGLNRIEALRHLIKIKTHLILAVRQRLHDLDAMPPADQSKEKILRIKHENLIVRLENEIKVVEFQIKYLEGNISQKIYLLKNCPERYKKDRKAWFKLLIDFVPFIGNALRKLTRSSEKCAAAEEPTGKEIIVDLDFLVDNPDEFLIML